MRISYVRRTWLLAGLVPWLWGLALGSVRAADPVLEWNATVREVIQHDGTNAINQANPGWSTRAIAMMNGSIYDVFQAIHRTHTPFLVDTSAPSEISLAAAVNQAAYDVLLHNYPGESSILNVDFASRMGLLPDDAAKQNGIDLGKYIAAQYVANRMNDKASESKPYTPLAGPGYWRPDPYNLDQKAWGPGWGEVSTWTIPNTKDFIDQLPPLPAMTSPEYTAAYNMVKDYGALDSAVRTPEQEAIGLFWAYDRPTMGPPPVLFVRNLEEIAAQAGTSPADNARLFALASVAMADSATAAWDAKFTYNFWRPVGAIIEGDSDGNPDTIGDDMWKPLGAPGGSPGLDSDDFTPPFPAWTSGHATMGGAIYKAVELFFGTNQFDAIDGILGNNPIYQLTSEEAGSGSTRFYSTFTQTDPLGIDTEDSPEGENAMSRIYLGIHWIMDQKDGTTLGNDISQYVYGNYFQPIPEPSTWLLATLGLAWVGCQARRRRRR